MRVSVISAVGLFGLLVSAGAQAQSMDEIVARHIDARGGYAQIKAIQTIKITRTVATPFANVKVVMYKKRPSLFRAEQGPIGQPPVARAINADAAWDTAQGKIVLRPAQAAAEAREIDGDFDGLLVDWKEKGHAVALEGREALTGGEAYKLKVTTKSGLVRYIYLDTKTLLDRRQSGISLPTNRKEDFVLDYSNWRAVEGVKFPFNLDEDRTGPQITQSFATYTEKIELNVPMEGSLFATPEGATAPAGK